MVNLNWKPIATAPKNKLILLAKDSGYVTYPWDYCVGKYEPHYRSHWTNIANDKVEPQPSYWTELPNPPEPVTEEKYGRERPFNEGEPTGSKLPVLRLHCAEGFTYSGYQRVIAVLEGEEVAQNISGDIARLYNALYRTRTGYPFAEEELLQLGEDSGCIFVLSGEGFTLEDFSENVVQATLTDLAKNIECYDAHRRSDG